MATGLPECGCQAVSTDGQQVDVSDGQSRSDYVATSGHLCLTAFLRDGGKAPIPPDRASL